MGKKKNWWRKWRKMGEKEESDATRVGNIKGWENSIFGYGNKKEVNEWKDRNEMAYKTM